MVPTGPSRNDPGWQNDPAVDAGFAAAYREDQRQDDAVTELDDLAAAADAAVVSSRAEGASTVIPAQPGPSPAGGAAAPAADDADAAVPGVGAAAVTPLVRPRLRPGRPVHSPGSDHRPPVRAVAGAAVAVGGVLLGIGSLLWVTDEPTRRNIASTAAPVSVASAPTAPVPTAPVVPPEVETAPVAPEAVAPEAVAPEAVAPEAVAAGQPEVLSSPVVPVTVLNNSDRDGLADRAAVRFERGGWPVQATGNFRGRIPVTTVYYDRGLEASARAFANTFPGVVRVRPRFETLPARGVVVVLTREYPT